MYKRQGDYIPVVASVALGEDGGFYNVNADMVAGHIAAAIGAHKVVFLTDVDGPVSYTHLSRKPCSSSARPSRAIFTMRSHSSATGRPYTSAS